MMLIRSNADFPLIVIATDPTDRIQRKLYRVKVDAVLERAASMGLFTALLEQRLELYARLGQHHEHAKRAQEPADGVQTLGPLQIDQQNYTVTKDGQPLNLTKKEFQLLAFLCNHQNQVLSREQLLAGVWGYDLVGTSRIVDIHISHLRDKIEDDPRHPVYLQTVRGFGYKLSAN